MDGTLRVCTALIALLYSLRAYPLDPMDFEAFNCPVNTALHLHSTGNNFVKMTCSPIQPCSVPVRCNPLIGSLRECDSFGAFVTGIQKHNEGLQMSCCQIESQQRLQEKCSKFLVTSDGAHYTGIDALPNGNGPSKENNAFGHSPMMRIFKNFESHQPMLMVKKVERMTNAYDITACKLECLEGSTPDDSSLPPLPFQEVRVQCDKCTLVIPELETALPTIANKGKTVVTQELINNGQQEVVHLPDKNCEEKTPGEQPSKGKTKKKCCCSYCNLTPREPAIHSSARPLNTNSRALGGGCFSGESLLRVDGKYRRMDSILIGDQVLIGPSEYDKVTMFLHKSRSAIAEFLLITTETNRSLEITANHLIPLFNCSASIEHPIESRRFQFASRAKVDHCLLVVGENENRVSLEKIVSVKKLIKQGVYAPLTTSGTIVVNGLLVSCYSQLENQQVQNLFHNAVNFVANALIKLCQFENQENPLLYLKTLLHLEKWFSSAF